jgi:hypothetical protein
MITLS